MIISFSPMKLQKDVVNNQPSQTFIKNLFTLVKTNFPGVTHIENSIPINTNTEFIANGNTPSPLPVEQFTALWIDEIHNAGYNVLFRGTACECEKIYNFPLHIDKHSYFVGRGTDFLTRYKDHLKDGDVFGVYPELEGHIWDGTGACINDTGNTNTDYNNFYLDMAQAVIDWSTQNTIKIKPYITVNRSEAINGWIHKDVWDKQGAVIIDYYGDTQTVDEMVGKIDEMYNKYLIAIFQQEWGDTRDPQVVANDPTHTAQMAQVFFDKIKEGKMIGINFWNLFDTPREGIITINGDLVTLNEKGKALAASFQKNFGTTPPTPQPPLPAYDHVVVVMMENSSYDQIIGNTNDCPYINSLLPKAANLSNIHAISHPSEPNYLAFISGSTQGRDGTDQNVDAGMIDAKTLVDSLEAKGLTWKGYFEGMPPDWYTRDNRTMGDTGDYTEHHNPFVYFTNINDKNTNPRLANIVPLTEFDPNNLPAFSFVSPSNNHNMHDDAGNINRLQAGDNFLKGFLPPVLQLSKTLVIVTWDEDDHSMNNQIPTLLLGEKVKPGYTSKQAYTHYATLLTIEELFGLSSLTDNDANAQVFDVFDTSPTPPPSQSTEKIIALTLINTDTQKEIKDLANGDIIDLASARNLAVCAKTNPQTVGSVNFGYDDNPNFHTENIYPYSLSGDMNGVFNPWTPVVGPHTIAATPYNQAMLGGNAGTPLSVNFTVVDTTHPSQPPIPIIPPLAFHGTIVSDGKGNITISIKI